MKASPPDLAAAHEPVGIVDIGSNSVRLVVFERLARNPNPLFNEKVLCAIGRNMVSTGRLDPAGLEAAYETLGRFRAIAESLGIKRLEVVATAAARDASNGREFVAKAQSICGSPVRILSGEEEAELAALGVLSGIPDADGVAGDLGGGSLELVPVAKGAIAGAGVTLPIGPLRLMDAAQGRIERARSIVDDQLRNVPGLDRLKGRTLYAVGGVWRNIGRIHMAVSRYPLHVLHHYEMSRSEALKFADLLAHQSRKSLERMAAVTKRRAEAVPYGAVVMARLLKVTEIDRVVISAYGVREGVLQSKLAPALRTADPLLETCREWSERQGRGPENGARIFRFLGPLFADETAAERRLREAACLLSDVGWRNHPDYRAEITFNEILQGGLAGTDHPGRVLVALSVFRRYAAEEEEPEQNAKAPRLLSGEQRLLADRIGFGARLAYVLCGPATDVLAECGIKLTPKELTLRLPKKREGLWGEAVEKRLIALANAFDRSPRLNIER